MTITSENSSSCNNKNDCIASFSGRWQQNMKIRSAPLRECEAILISLGKAAAVIQDVTRIEVFTDSKTTVQALNSTASYTVSDQVTKRMWLARIQKIRDIKIKGCSWCERSCPAIAACDRMGRGGCLEAEAAQLISEETAEDPVEEDL